MVKFNVLASAEKLIMEFTKGNIFKMNGTDLAEELSPMAIIT